MTIDLDALIPKLVALHPEGVDRNANAIAFIPNTPVALHPEGVDRNLIKLSERQAGKQSPSTRRAWIEMIMPKYNMLYAQSPSTRRAWIEIPRCL